MAEYEFEDFETTIEVGGRAVRVRITRAVWKAEAGAPMSQIAQFMGHDDSATTEKHYARFSPGFLRGAANALRIE